MKELTTATLLFLILTAAASPKEQHRLAKLNREGRIVGGEDARAGQFPFAAAVTVQTSNSRFFCSGSLVGYQWILTAGHCVDGAVLFTITLGSNNLSEDNPNSLTLATRKYYLHPDYDRQTLSNDIGLIELLMPVQWTPYIEAISLPYKDLDEIRAVTAVGWGQTSDSDEEFSENLKFISVSTITNTECRMTYGNQIGDGVVCIAGNYNEGTCIGDSGAPLLEYNNNSYTMWHAGVGSFVSGNGCDSLDPSGFTRTFSYLKWLQTIVR